MPTVMSIPITMPHPPMPAHPCRTSLIDNKEALAAGAQGTNYCAQRTPSTSSIEGLQPT